MSDVLQDNPFCSMFKQMMSDVESVYSQDESYPDIIERNVKKHSEAIKKLEKAMSVVMESIPDYSHKQFQKGCDKLKKFYLDGFAYTGTDAAGVEHYIYLGEKCNF